MYERFRERARMRRIHNYERRARRRKREWVQRNTHSWKEEWQAVWAELQQKWLADAEAQEALARAQEERKTSNQVADTVLKSMATLPI